MSKRLLRSVRHKKSPRRVNRNRRSPRGGKIDGGYIFYPSSNEKELADIRLRKNLGNKYANLSSTELIKAQEQEVEKERFGGLDRDLYLKRLTENYSTGNTKRAFDYFCNLGGDGMLAQVRPKFSNLGSFGTLTDKQRELYQIMESNIKKFCDKNAYDL